MLVVDDKKNIKLSRGDYAEISFNFKNADGTEYVLEEGENVEFTVKTSASSQEELISKNLSSGGGSFVVLVLEKEDTEQMTFGNYYYDIRLIKADGKINTPMLKANFEVLEVIGDGN
jgi:hypothetical protein